MSYRFLSYKIHPDIPVYGSTPKPVFEKKMNMETGDHCNTAFFEMSNHSGTHADAPRHFCKSGRTIDSYGAGELIFESPVVVEAPAGPGELIGPEPFEALGDKLAEADFLIVRTGFHVRRDEPVYYEANPGLSEEAAVFIRENAVRLRGLGIDSISVSSFKHRETGRAVHRICFQDEQSGSSPLLLVEDMDLSGDLSGLQRVIVAPLALKGLDSAPCTVIGRFS